MYIGSERERESRTTLRYLSGGAVHDSRALGKIMDSVWGPERWENNGTHKANRRNSIQEVAGEPRKSCL